MIPKTQKFKQLKYLEFDDKNSIGETIRKVSIDKSTKTISLLVLDCISQNEASLKIETYDYDMNFLKSYDISNISDDSNELIQAYRFLILKQLSILSKFQHNKMYRIYRQQIS